MKENGVPASEMLSDPTTSSPYPVKSKFSRLTRSSGIHEGLTSLTKPGSNHSEYLNKAVNKDHWLVQVSTSSIHHCHLPLGVFGDEF